MGELFSQFECYDRPFNKITKTSILFCAYTLKVEYYRAFLQYWTDLQNFYSTSKPMSVIIKIILLKTIYIYSLLIFTYVK